MIGGCLLPKSSMGRTGLGLFPPTTSGWAGAWLQGVCSRNCLKTGWRLLGRPTPRMGGRGPLETGLFCFRLCGDLFLSSRNNNFREPLNLRRISTCHVLYTYTTTRFLTENMLPWSGFSPSLGRKFIRERWSVLDANFLKEAKRLLLIRRGLAGKGLS